MDAQSRDIIVTDLDGTLLEERSYSFEPARSALDRLKRRNTPVVFCTSKTRAEVEYWRQAMGNTHPFIVENGGALYLPRAASKAPLEGFQDSGDYLVYELGSPYQDLLATLRKASQETGCPVRGFADLTVDQVAALCGLPPDQAALAKQREYDEPFESLAPERTSALAETIHRYGKRWTRGGLFDHITGGNDKGSAVRILLEIYRRELGTIRTIGLGDGLNDTEFLAAMDVAVLIRSRHVDRLQQAVPKGIVTSERGPRGWNEAILNLVPA